MRKMIFILLSVVTVGIGLSFGNSRDVGSKVAVVKQGDIFQVIYEGSESGAVNVTISDEDGNSVFREKIVGTRFRRPYNFSRLPEGDYVVCVKDDNRSHTQTICHHGRSWFSHIRRLPASESKYLVAIPATSNSDVIVSVHDQNGTLVFNELVLSEASFAKVFCLKNLEGGSISISDPKSGDVKAVPVD